MVVSGEERRWVDEYNMLYRFQVAPRFIGKFTSDRLNVAGGRLQTQFSFDFNQVAFCSCLGELRRK